MRRGVHFVVGVATVKASDDSGRRKRTAPPVSGVEPADDGCFVVFSVTMSLLRRAFAPAIASFLVGSLFTSGESFGGEVELETVTQVRHDHFGDLYVPTWQLFRFDQAAGPVEVQGYGGLEWMAGLSQPLDADIYDLHVGGDLLGGSWAVGRQQGLAALRRQTFDGVSYSHPLGERFRVGTWAGMARHQDADDLHEWAAMGRAELGFTGDHLRARAGFEMADGLGTYLVAREDVEAWLSLGSGPRPSRLGGRILVAERPGSSDSGEATIIEWARLEFSARPVSPLETSVHVQHREAADPGSLFGDAILDALAGGAVQEAGLGIRVLGARWSALSVRTALVGYGEGHEWGHKADISWMPGRSNAAVRVSPAFVSRTGPGGRYHGASARVLWRASDATALSGRGAVVPFQKNSEPWDVVLSYGFELQHAFASWLRVGALVEAASDRERLVDVRGGATLNLGWSS